MATPPNNQGVNFKVAATDTTFSDTMKKAQQAARGLSDDNKGLQRALAAASKAMQEAGADSSALDAAFKKLKASGASLNDVLKETNQFGFAAGKGLREAADGADKLNASSGLVVGNLRGMGTSLRGLGSVLGDHSAGVAGKLGILANRLAGLPAPLAAAVLGAEGLSMAFKGYEETQTKLGEQLQEESKLVASATTEWHKMAQTIQNVEALKKGFVPGGSLFAPSGASPVEIEKHYKTLGERVKNLSSEAVFDEINKPGDSSSVAATKSKLQAAVDALGKSGTILTDLRKKAEDLSKIVESQQKAEDEQFRGRYGHYDKHGDFVQDRERPLTDEAKKLASLQEQIKTAEFDQRGPKSTIATLNPILAKLQSIADLDKTLKEDLGRVSESKSITGVYGGREGLTQQVGFSADVLAQALAKYKSVTGRQTDEASLLQVMRTGTDAERARTGDLVKLFGNLQSAKKELGNFDVGTLEAGLSARKDRGGYGTGDPLSATRLPDSFEDDELSTIGRERKLLAPHDQKGAADLDRREFKAKQAKGKNSFESTIGGLVDNLDELKAAGASAAELLKANKAIADAAAKWKGENATILGQYGELGKEVDKVLEKTKIEAEHAKRAQFGENFAMLKTHITEAGAAAQNFQDRLAANKSAIEDTNAAFAKGLIDQKQRTEELNALDKERGNLNREVLKAQEAQVKVIDGLKGKLAGQELKGLQEQIAQGKGPAGAEQQVEQLQGREVAAKLKQIQDEYEIARKGPMGEVLAAQEASLKKQALWQEEVNAFQKAEDAKTSILKAADKNRIGGSASPLVGLNEGAAFSGVQFSGFDKFGDNFGKFHRTKSAFDTYKDAQLPDPVQDAFKSSDKYMSSAQPQMKAGDTINVHLSLQAIPPDVEALGKQIGRKLADVAQHRALVVGDGAPAMMTNSSDAWMMG